MTKRIDSALAVLYKTIVHAKPGKDGPLGGVRRLGKGEPIQLELQGDEVAVKQGDYTRIIHNLGALKQNPNLLRTELVNLRSHPLSSHADTDNKRKIPYPHEAGKVKDSKRTVDDHHYLSRQDVHDLVKEAEGANFRRFNEIQVRLGQGIVGMTYPQPLESSVDEKLCELEEHFVSARRANILSNPKLADHLYRIMVS